MEKKREIKISIRGGLHTRLVAIIVKEVVKIEKELKVKLYIQYGKRGITPIGSAMSFIFIKIKEGEIATLYAKGDSNLEEALDRIEPFFTEYINEFLSKESGVIDSFITDKALTVGEIFNAISNGILFSNTNNEVTFVNEAAVEFIGINSENLINKNIDEIIRDVKKVSSQDDNEIFRGKLGNKTFLIYKKQLSIEGVYRGDIHVLDDISILEEVIDEFSIVKELKEKLQLIIETVGDGICVINNEGCITYVNENYKRMVGKEDVIGKNVYNISPNGIRSQVLKTGVPAIGEIIEKENFHKLVCSVFPLIVDTKQVGVVSLIKEIADVKQLTNKLNKASERVKYLEEELIRTKKPHEAFDRYIGRSGKVIDSLALASKAAKSNATVIIRGGSGTGKELIAEGIHYASDRSKGPFIRVNCAAIPESLIESELFGYEKGAFTGAIKRKLGKFELAQNGTLFLDEIGEMDKNMQSKILRVLQYKEFQRVGGESTVKVNVRIISATHRNLEEMVKEGEFREDLYYRLNVIQIKLPPLCERKEDIPLLVDHFLTKLNDNEKSIKGISTEALEALMNYSWRGNVRELENVIERTLALCEDEIIQSKDLPRYILEREKIIEEKIETNNRKDEIIDIIEEKEILPLREYEKIIIEKALKKYGSYNKAGKALGITHRTVALKAKQYGIEKIVTWKH